MSTSSEVTFGILFIVGYLGSPILLIWGWSRWVKQPKMRSAPCILSLTSLILASVSALLAVSTMAYAQVHHFSFYDPLLLRIFRWGALLSVGGFLFGIAGVWRPGPLRWHAPACGFAMLTFWILAAAGE